MLFFAFFPTILKFIFCEILDFLLDRFGAHKWSAKVVLKVDGKEEVFMVKGENKQSFKEELEKTLDRVRKIKSSQEPDSLSSLDL